METSAKQMEALRALLLPVNMEGLHLRFNTVAASTAIGYVRLYECLQRRIDLEDDINLTDVILRTCSKNTYYARTAAAQYVLFTEIERHRDAAWNAIYSGDDNAYRSACWLLKEAVRSLNAVLSLRGKCRLHTKDRRHSKRKILRELPPDWRERLWVRLSRSKYSLSFLVAALTGCRPRELENGVDVQLVKKEGTEFLTFKLAGAKVKETQGQPQRQIDYAADSTMFLIVRIVAQLRFCDGEAYVKIDNGRNFTVAITRAARKLWPNTSEDITAYCLRHQGSADFKTTLPPEQVAMALGHSSVLTQKFYGQKQQSRSAQKLAPVLARASREVRHVSVARMRGCKKKRDSDYEL